MILSLDCSTPTLSLALVEWAEAARPEHFGRPRLVAGRDLPHGGQHGAELPVQIQALLAEAGVGLDALRGCAVGMGPGSFTGLRVGIATLKGICFARSLPLQGVSTLRALAFEVASGSAPDALFCPLLDARRGELYAGLYRGPSAEPVLPELSLPPEGLPGYLAQAGAARLFGEGLHAQQASIERLLAGTVELDLAGPRAPSAFVIARLAGPPVPFARDALFALEPRYLRLSQAEVKFPNGNFTPHATG